jgi:hypothetical protein
MIRDVEILRTGKHTAANGMKVVLETGDLEKIAKSFDPAFHESPVVIGHPKDNEPAYGWVKALRVAGDRLLADLDLVPEFVEALRKGLFKKRSASIYPDLDGRGPYLRHVGFLGAMPPAVKALADINLNDGKESITIEFQEKEQGKMSWKEKVKNLFVQAVDEIPETGAPVQPPVQPAAVGFSEEDVKRREAEAAKKAREEAELEFAEKMRKTEADQRIEARKAQAKSVIDRLQKDGRLLPAEVKGGLLDFCDFLAGCEGELSFAEGGAKAPHAWFLSFLEAQPKKIDLGEFAGREKDGDAGAGSAAAKLGTLVQQKMAANQGMAYSIAFSEVQREHPELAEEYFLELRG